MRRWRVATASGIDWKRLSQDLQHHNTEISTSLGRTDREARFLGLHETATLIIGNLLYSGRLDGRQLTEAISVTRAY